MGWRITFDGTERELTTEELLDPFTTRWTGGKVVDLDDLSPDVYDAIAASENGQDSWWGVYRFPCASAARMLAVANAAANHAGVAAVPKPANMREAEELMCLFERSEDIEKKPVVNGFPQTPAEPESGSSSGPQDDSVGDPPKSEESLSATS